MPPRIVVLDGYTLNPGDLDWSPLSALGRLELHDRSTPAQIIERSRGAQVLLTNKAPLPAATIEQLPGLRYIGVTATGVNIVDLDAARRHGVVVTNVPGYGAASVAQHVFALLLELASHTGAHDREVRAGRWAAGPDWSFTVAPMVELAGKTMGIVGLGSIGQNVARIARAMGMSIAAAHQSSEDRLKRSGQIADLDVQWMSVDELFRVSDVVSLHCPLTEATRGLVNAQRLATMKPTAFLINTGRGPLVDEAALADALRAGRIAGAGLDVLSSEPPAPDNPLLQAPRCVITPHIAWATREARQRLLAITAANIKAFLDGQPVNVVNPS